MKDSGLDSEIGPSIQVKSKVLSGVENLKRVLEKSVRDSLATHYGSFSGMASLALILRYLVPASEIQTVIDFVKESWAKEARRSIYPFYVKQRDCITAAHPNLGDPFSGDEVFDRAVSETLEIIQKSLEEGPVLLNLKNPDPPTEGQNS